jgi:hypothetical protein
MPQMPSVTPVERLTSGLTRVERQAPAASLAVQGATSAALAINLIGELD